MATFSRAHASSQSSSQQTAAPPVSAKRSHPPARRDDAAAARGVGPVRSRFAPAVGNPSVHGGRRDARGGHPLPDAVRSKMERAFGADFSAIRVHQDGKAAAIGAMAYARGHDIHFADGRYQTAGRSGQEMLGHELAHVVQQRLGRVAAPHGAAAPIREDAGLEQEADVLGAAAARNERLNVAGARRAAQPRADVIQPTRGPRKTKFAESKEASRQLRYATKANAPGAPPANQGAAVPRPTVFENNEGLLPAAGKGYHYVEGDVGSGRTDRGRQRVVHLVETSSGRTISQHYTGDHYRSFKRKT